jgi:hypothetical protein
LFSPQHGRVIEAPFDILFPGIHYVPTPFVRQ